MRKAGCKVIQTLYNASRVNQATCQSQKMTAEMLISSVYNPVYSLSAPIKANFKCPKP